MVLYLLQSEHFIFDCPCLLLVVVVLATFYCEMHNGATSQFDEPITRSRWKEEEMPKAKVKGNNIAYDVSGR
jgi:hypothetical protein